MSFDIGGTPPTPNELSALMIRSTQRKAHALLGIGFLIAVAFIILVIAWLNGSIQGNAAGALAGSIVLVLSLTTAGACSAIGVNSRVPATAIFISVALVPFIAHTGGEKWFMASLLVAITMMGVVTLAIIGLQTARSPLTGEPLLSSLNALKWMELDCSTHPNMVVALDEWRDQDETIDAYLDAVSRMGRMPVVGEYWAAKDWIARQRIQARKACERMTASA